jgi:hypothetical protein
MENYHNGLKSGISILDTRFKTFFEKAEKKFVNASKAIDEFDDDKIKILSDPFNSKKIKELRKDYKDKIKKIQRKIDKKLDEDFNDDEVDEQTKAFQRSTAAAAIGRNYTQSNLEQRDFGIENTIIDFSKDTKDFLTDLFLKKFRLPKMVGGGLGGGGNGKGGLGFGETVAATALGGLEAGIVSGIISRLGISGVLLSLTRLGAYGLLLGGSLLALDALAKGPLNESLKGLVKNTVGVNNILYAYLNKSGFKEDGSRRNSEENENEILKAKYISMGLYKGAGVVGQFNKTTQLRNAFAAEKDVALPTVNVLNKTISQIPGVRAIYSRFTGQDIRPETMKAAEKLKDLKTQTALEEAAIKQAKIAERLKELTRGIGFKRGLSELKAMEIINKEAKTSVDVAKGIEEAGILSKYVKYAPGLSSILKGGIGKFIWRKIPIIGTMIGLALGFQQLKAGDTGGGIMTILSSLAINVPVFGTIVSVLLDAINFSAHKMGLFGTEEEKANIEQLAMEGRVKNADVLRSKGVAEELIQQYIKTGKYDPNPKKSEARETRKVRSMMGYGMVPLSQEENFDDKPNTSLDQQKSTPDKTLHDFSLDINPMANRALILNGKKFSIDNDDTLTAMPKGGLNAEFKQLRDTLISIHKSTVNNANNKREPSNNNISNVNVSSQSKSSGSSARDLNYITRNEWWKYTTQRGAII